LKFKRLTTAAKCLAGLFLIVCVLECVRIFRSREEGMHEFVAFQFLTLLFCVLIAVIVLFFLHRASPKGNQHLHEIVHCALWWSAISVMYFSWSSYVIVMFVLSIFSRCQPSSYGWKWPALFLSLANRRIRNRINPLIYQVDIEESWNLKLIMCDRACGASCRATTNDSCV
jgi:hypothetical protein